MIACSPVSPKQTTCPLGGPPLAGELNYGPLTEFYHSITTSFNDFPWRPHSCRPYTRSAPRPRAAAAVRSMADPTMPEDGAARTAAPRNARSTLTLSRIAAFTAAIGLAGAAAWYFSPLGHEFRFAHSDLISLDSEAANHPDDGLAWYYLGLRMEEKGDPGGAVGALQQ